MTARSCGDCRLCCVLLDVPPVEKPAGSPCRHLCAAGCGVYETRPECCREFECAWLRGVMPSSLRPDRVGGLVWITTLVSPNTEREMPVITLSASAHKPLNSRLLRWTVARSGKMPVVVERGQQRELFVDGRRLVRWHNDDFITVDEKDGKIVGATVKPWRSVFANKRERDEARAAQARKVTIEETLDEYVEVMP